jgi:hypothetical protein
VTKRSGSADVLEALGVRLDIGPERLGEAIETIGVGFVFARAHHPAMRFVAPIRADLQARTIFNNLGPLTNPAGATRQLLGVYDAAWTEPLAEVLRGLGVERALVVHGDGLDDLALSGPSQVSELHADGRIETTTVHPEALGVAPAPLAAILGGDAAANAAVARATLAGELQDARRDVVALCAGATLYLAGLAPDLRSGARRPRAAARRRRARGPRALRRVHPGRVRARAAGRILRTHRSFASIASVDGRAVPGSGARERMRRSAVWHHERTEGTAAGPTRPRAGARIAGRRSPSCLRTRTRPAASSSVPWPSRPASPRCSRAASSWTSSTASRRASPRTPAPPR